jgi:hypothetical protein
MVEEKIYALFFAQAGYDIDDLSVGHVNIFQVLEMCHLILSRPPYENIFLAISR